MDWFRVYSSILDKPNVCGLPPDVLGYWLLFLAVANRSSPRGTIPSSPVELGWAIHRDPTEVEKMRDRLIQSGLLEWEGESLRFHKWNLYQAPSTERASISKAAKKAAKQHSATTSNNEQHSATEATQEREREERELRKDSQESNNQQPEATVSNIEQHDASPASIELDGPIGVNSAKAVREVLYTANELWPLTSIRIQCRTWLARPDGKADRVIAAMMRTHDKGAVHPGPYVTSLLDDPSFPQARKNGPPSKPSKAPIVLECEKMFVNPDKRKPE